VVDLDLEKLFDRVNHYSLMANTGGPARNPIHGLLRASGALFGWAASGLTHAPTPRATLGLAFLDQRADSVVDQG
jgi:hypothetical protein